LLRKILPNRALFATLLRIGQFFRAVSPHFVRNKIPPKQKQIASAPKPLLLSSRRMLCLQGCVQSAATPNTTASARRVLNKLGISLISASKAGCCGAVNYHLSAHNDGLDDMRRNIDAWWPLIEPESGPGVEAIVSTASGCGSMLADYGRLLANDSPYAAKALRVSELSKDISEIILTEDMHLLAPHTAIGKVAVHTPCSLQHALNLPDAITTILSKVGFDLADTTEAHLCCGSAGTYSILQSDISERLLDKKLLALNIDQPTLIATANIGCQLQMGTKSKIPVRHWIELLDESSP
jgi:glycolate oxidase iron-sulfur subunit